MRTRIIVKNQKRQNGRKRMNYGRKKKEEEQLQ
jgi:hypothetical protein